MMIKFFLGLTIIGILISCTNNNKTAVQDDNNSNKQIQSPDPFDKIIKLKLPLIISSDNWNDMFKKYGNYSDNDNYKLLKHPFARLIDKEKFEAIICTVPSEVESPAFVTIDRNGKVIDSLFLVGKYGGNDPCYGISEYAIINTDLTIQIIDTTYTWDVDKDYSRIDNSKKMTVQNELYKVLDNGIIKKIK
ncbi:MAG: hypothetical protein WCQ95_08910 [Bacteroidota bacterium]